jgi:hypothetical protein
MCRVKPRTGWAHSEAKGLRTKVVSQSPTLNFENVHHPHPKGFFTHHKTQGITLSMNPKHMQNHKTYSYYTYSINTFTKETGSLDMKLVLIRVIKP